MKNRILVLLVAGALAAIGAWAVIQKSAQTEVSNAVRPAPPPQMSPPEIAALKAKAESGDASAQTRLGWIYQKGDGVKPDMKEAVKWFKMAADQDFPDGLAALGELTQAGQGVKTDLTEAARLYRSAAEKGSVAGQYNLAYLYEQGSGVEKSQTEAAKWYELAAQGGDPIAQYDIGQRYLLGVGVGTNLVQALKWLTLAARQGQPDASDLSRGLKAQMTTEEIAKANELARAFLPRPASVTRDSKNQMDTR